MRSMDRTGSTTSSSDVSAEQLEHLVLMATYAPSVHNTQPWLFVPTRDGVLLRADRTRQLPVLDPYGRDLLLSCGAAVHHLSVAARALGLDASVELFPHEGVPDDVAHVRLQRGGEPTPGEQATAVAILHRHTERGRFPVDGLSPQQLDQLRTAVEAEHAMLRDVKPAELVELQVLVSTSEQALLQTPGYTAELDQWVWQGRQPQERGDGLPPEAIAHGEGRAEALQGRQFDGVVPPRPDEPPVPEHPAVVLLTTLADEPSDWVQAGRALSALLLAATGAGLLAQPLSQVVDVPQTRWAVQRLLGTVGIPQMLLRLGQGTNLPLSPRRPVTEVLTTDPLR